jgi:FkbM family methyltransferase
MSIKSVIKRFLYFNLRIKLENKTFVVPIIKGIGAENLKLKNDWFIFLLNKVTLPENSTFIDVGVNIGQTILKFRSHYDNPYFGFEINSNCVSYARNLIKVNGFKNISILPVGLSNQDEVVVMNSNSDIDNCCTGSTIVSDLRPTFYREVDKSYVPVYKFDNLNILDPKSVVSMVKVDVEGAELDAISGMLEMIKKHQPLITCEILDFDSELTAEKLQDRASKLYDLMRSLNYDVYAIKHLETSLRFEKISEIKLVRWTPASLELNDYIFVPANNKYVNLKD